MGGALRTRAAVRARVLADQPDADVSRELGITEVASRQRVRRGLDALRRLLAGGSG